MSESKISLAKHHFFHHIEENQESYFFNEPDFNLNQLRFEFSSLYQLFLSNKEFFAQNIETALYLDSMCDLMICYYQFDYVDSELQKLYKQKNEIMVFIKEIPLDEDHPSIKALPVFLMERLKTNIQEYTTSFTSIAQLRRHLGNLNSNRSQFNYSRSLATHALEYLKNKPFIQELNAILGDQYNFVNGLNLLNGPFKCEVQQ